MRSIPGSISCSFYLSPSPRPLVSALRPWLRGHGSVTGDLATSASLTAVCNGHQPPAKGRDRGKESADGETARRARGGLCVSHRKNGGQARGKPARDFKLARDGSRRHPRHLRRARAGRARGASEEARGRDKAQQNPRGQGHPQQNSRGKRPNSKETAAADGKANAEENTQEKPRLRPKRPQR